MSGTDGPETTRVTDKGQTTIPKALREKYGIEPGDEVVWVEEEDGIMLRKKGDLPNYGFLAEDMTEEEARAVSDALKEDMDELQRPSLDR
ncbi:AbrB/MazE/SpoVT family DNA-binding domain-containing protein [Haloglomus litoreum]|uniref:AbrB/MazE/SpoVT family DNA-binding domain-containing protein n=1 Tax=Haloglomus litoreum TaxID=3034026 RepID=UPI0023E8913E|nr:AbrB/MazE/SpoVT family DNA-binding domain-containing protein [Haloglomus sp. DT116]